MNHQDATYQSVNKILTIFKPGHAQSKRETIHLGKEKNHPKTQFKNNCLLPHPHLAISSSFEVQYKHTHSRTHTHTHTQIK